MGKPTTWDGTRAALRLALGVYILSTIDGVQAQNCCERVVVSATATVDGWTMTPARYNGWPNGGLGVYQLVAGETAGGRPVYREVDATDNIYNPSADFHLHYNAALQRGGGWLLDPDANHSPADDVFPAVATSNAACPADVAAGSWRAWAVSADVAGISWHAWPSMSVRCVQAQDCCELVVVSATATVDGWTMTPARYNGRPSGGLGVYQLVAGDTAGGRPVYREVDATDNAWQDWHVHYNTAYGAWFLDRDANHSPADDEIPAVATSNAACPADVAAGSWRAWAVSADVAGISWQAWPSMAITCGCSSHTQCGSTQYCDTGNLCHACSSCAVYDDALPGLASCDSWCASLPPTSPAPTTASPTTASPTAAPTTSSPTTSAPTIPSPTLAQTSAPSPSALCNGNPDPEDPCITITIDNRDMLCAIPHFVDQCLAACDSCPTGSPTGSPAEPTTRAATTATPQTPSCPRNCGAPSSGGGTCRPNGRCTSCNANKVIQSGRCYSTIACKGRRIQSGSQTGASCRCLDDRCHYCNRRPSGDVCRVCRDGWYLLDDACVVACPAGSAMLGLGDFKRRCMEPFECQNGRLVGSDVNYGCKCANDDMTPSACQFCSFRADEHGTHCTRCLGGTFLRQSDNRCHADCAGTGLIEYTPGNYGRECRAPFICTDRTDEAGNACKCARSVGRNACLVCGYGTGGVSCSRCTNSMYLENGACVEACSSGSPSGSGADGRECQ